MKAHTLKRPAGLAQGSVSLLLGSMILFVTGVQADTTPASNKARNVILFIADGCGFNHLAAAGIYLNGEPDTLPFQSFPVRCAVATFSDLGSYDPTALRKSFSLFTERATDSAAAATAMATGIKTAIGRIGVDAEDRRMTNILEQAKNVGKRTGVVTSVPWSHATPAGFVAHVESRGDYASIASQMVFQSEVDVIMGCGHPDQAQEADASATNTIVYARKTDNAAVAVGGAAVWNALRRGEAGNDADRDGQVDRWTLIEDRRAFQSLAATTSSLPKRVLGTARALITLQQDRPEPTHSLQGVAGSERSAGPRSSNSSGQNSNSRLDPESSAPFKVPFDPNVPSLAEMTRAAINVMAWDPDGFVLVIEGGAVDWAAHDNNAARMIEEVLAFSEAIDAVTNWVETSSSWSETLVIVTADHETGYLTGPDSGQDGHAPVWLPVRNNGKGKMPSVQWNSRGHTNQLVPLYAKGTGAGGLLSYPKWTDPQHGIYIDNTSIGRFINSMLGGSLDLSGEPR